MQSQNPATMAASVTSQRSRNPGFIDDDIIAAEPFYQCVQVQSPSAPAIRTSAVPGHAVTGGF